MLTKRNVTNNIAIHKPEYTTTNNSFICVPHLHLNIIFLEQLFALIGATINQSPVLRKAASASSSVSASSPVWLSDSTRTQLEHLMMQGDMLEVTLDETQLLWKVLKACQSNTVATTPRKVIFCLL